jgi:hypothetical protein
MKLVVAQLLTYVLNNQQTGGHAQSEPEDVDKGKHFVFPEIPPGNE